MEKRKLKGKEMGRCTIKGNFHRKNQDNKFVLSAW